jgi:hypothetical protein
MESGVLTLVTVKETVWWDVTPCSLVGRWVVIQVLKERSSPICRERDASNIFL